MCTFNVRSLASEERYLELNNALKNINCDILGLSEVRRLGCNIEEHYDYIFCYIGQTKGLHGVGFLIKKKYKNNIKNFTGISERVALLQLKFECFPVSIIQVYAPTEKSPKVEIDQFYRDVEAAHALADEKVLVIGDFNAKIGHPKADLYPVMGKYGFGERNESGDRLINYAYQHKLSIMNTFFKKKENRKWTWISPDLKTKNEIDFIMINNPKLITNVEILNNIQFPSDHRPLRATLLLSRPIKCRKNFVTPLNIPKTEVEIKTYIENLNIHMKGKEAVSSDIQTYYNFLEKVLTDSLMSKNRTQKERQKIFSKDTDQLIKRRTELIRTNNKTKDMKNELSRIYKETNKSIKRDYRNHRQEIITRNIKNFRSAKRAYKELITHKTWIQKLEQKSTETKSRKDIIHLATNFYKNLYQKRNNRDIEIQSRIGDETDQDHVKPFEDVEIYKHIKRLKSEKSPGSDGLCNEVLKIGAPILIHYLLHLFNMVLETETVPEQWCTSDIILLYKKGNPLDIGNYRPISLLASIYKLFSSLLLERLSQDIDQQQPREQAGFRSGFSTTDHIHTLEQIIEKYREFNRPLYLAFIDYSKAFDSISHCSIWNALQCSNIKQKYINILKFIYANSTSKVKLENRGEVISIERGVRQGDPLSPKLFIAVLENIFRKLDWSNKGVLINGCYINHLRFADDIVIISETFKDLEEMMRSLDDESSSIGLEMNVNKTKIMTNSHKRYIEIKGNNIEYVNNYIYLGKQVSFNKYNNEEEITRRINITWKKFWSLKEVLKGNYSQHLKKVVFDTCLLPCLLYGCQTWIFTNKVKQHIKWTQTAMERSMLKIRKIQKIKNVTIRQKTKITDALIHALTLKWKWAGHISRYTDKRWTIETTRWKGPIGKRNVGRPMTRWADDIIQVAGKEWMNSGKDRELWKKMEEAFTLTGIHI